MYTYCNTGYHKIKFIISYYQKFQSKSFSSTKKLSLVSRTIFCDTRDALILENEGNSKEHNEDKPQAKSERKSKANAKNTKVTQWHGQDM